MYFSVIYCVQYFTCVYVTYTDRKVLYIWPMVVNGAKNIDLKTCFKNKKTSFIPFNKFKYEGKRKKGRKKENTVNALALLNSIWDIFGKYWKANHFYFWLLNCVLNHD